MLCAGVLALGLTGCGGGGGGQRSGMDTPAVQVTDTIRAAREAVDALTPTSPAAQLRAAEAAVRAAKRAVAATGALSKAEKAAHTTTLSVIEGNLDAARERILMARRDRAATLTAALTADRITDVAITAAPGTAPTLRGTVPGASPPAVTDLETTAVAGSVMTEPGGVWMSGVYTADDTGAETSDQVVLYTDIDASLTRPFSGEMGKYGVADGINDAGELVIGSATDATLIASSEFPTTAGNVVHEAGANGRVELAGTFDGARGTYVCTPAMDNGCTSSIRRGGGIALAGGGGWMFVPEEGATVTEPDRAYHYFGWWLRVAANGRDAIGIFHGGVGDAPDFTALPTLQTRQGEPVLYHGPAVGQFVLNPQIGAAQAGEFTARAELRVDFGDAAALGTVTGTVDDFTVEGEAVHWSVELQSAAIGADGGITSDDTTHQARTVWAIDGEQGTLTDSSEWSGQFRDVDKNEVPNVATGTFEATYGALGHLSGAFGTTAEQP